MPIAVRIIKRFIDLSAGLVGLVLTVPLYPLLAAIIYLDSPGPVFFRQRRAGRLLGHNGRGYEFVEFNMYKFRTMRPDAEKLTGAVIAAEGDPRVTRIGRFLRKSRLDEIPQLWNVVNGTMSLVGPRPERPELLNDLAMAIPLFEERMRDVKPGITGLAQVSLGYAGRPPAGSEVLRFNDDLTNPFDLEEADGATADEMRMKLLYDLAYVASLEKLTTFVPMELSIMLKTPWVMIRGAGR